MDDVFDFDTQLKVGNEGERAFLKRYAHLQPEKSLDRRYDFVLKNGKTVELKTDTYEMSRTPNFFMEIFGSVDEQKLGGPWRALHDGVTFFVYYFAKDGVFFWFETESLCKALDTLIASGNYSPRSIQNRGWAARGYTIPRALLMGILLKQEK